MYKHFFKRIFDIIISLIGIIILSPVYIIISICVLIFMGWPFLFKQPRPGKNSKIFNMYKFRTMTNKKDKDGNLLPDDQRLPKFGKLLRSTSLDELPELFCILFGKMSFIGPRPMLVRDMVFFDEKIMKRQSVMPGLTGWAQANGRNSINWDERFKYDLEYVEKISFLMDLKVVFLTIKTVLKREGIGEDGGDLSIDYGDYLLKYKRVTKKEYDQKQQMAKNLLSGVQKALLISNNNTDFSVAMSVYKNDNPLFFDNALDSIINKQTVKPSEIVLVVDGPVDSKLNDIIAKYESNYNFIKTIRLKSNTGLGNALKVAVDNSKFELIARMDSDDISMPTRFAEQLSIFNYYKDVDIVGGDITEFIDSETNIVGRRTVPIDDSDIKNYMKTRCAMNHVTVMFKKSSILKAGNYQDWFWNEDYYLWIRMLQHSAMFCNTGTVLVNVRVGNDMYKRRGGKKYFESEVKLQKYMLHNKIISFPTYFINVVKRFIIQILLPNNVRGFVFRKLARKKK